MRFQIIGCDKCGVREDKKPVKTWTARRGTTRYTGDLCDKCWDLLVKEFSVSNMTSSRHQIIITDIDDIPKG